MLQSGEQKPAEGVEIKTEKKFGLNEERFIVCKNCGNRITSSENIISVDGHHTHTFTNPEGFTYEISCFSVAEGCAVDVDPTLENTWFEGFSWSFSVCSNCLTHMGWFYERGDEGFFGLILDRLVDRTTTH